MKPDRPTKEILKFEFHFYKVRCMLQESQFYLMKILFDDCQYQSTLQTGKNPKFNFDKIIIKEMRFDEMESKYFEIIIYCLPSSFDCFKEGGSIENMIKKSKIFSSFKIDLLTLAVGPEYHNIILTSPKNSEKLGRIMYTITCKQISNISVKINSVKIQMNELLQNNIALSLKYNQKNKQKSNSLYTHEINPNLNQKEKKTEYNYFTNENQRNPLTLNIKSSMIDFTSNDSYLNVYSIRLIKNTEDNNEYNKGNIFEHNPELKNNKDLTNNLINHYTKIGFALLSFIEILSENDEALNKQASQFFRHMSGFNKPVEFPIKTEPENNSAIKTFTIQIFQDIFRLIKFL